MIIFWSKHDSDYSKYKVIVSVFVVLLLLFFSVVDFINDSFLSSDSFSWAASLLLTSTESRIKPKMIGDKPEIRWWVGLLLLDTSLSSRSNCLASSWIYHCPPQQSSPSLPSPPPPRCEASTRLSITDSYPISFTDDQNDLNHEHWHSSGYGSSSPPLAVCSQNLWHCSADQLCNGGRGRVTSILHVIDLRFFIVVISLFCCYCWYKK